MTFRLGIAGGNVDISMRRQGEFQRKGCVWQKGKPCCDIFEEFEFCG